MSSYFTDDEIAALESPHIARAWFGQFDFPDGMKYWHAGTGKKTIDGNEYIGVSDPVRGQLVSIGQVEEPQFGQAAAVQIILAGASIAFIQSVKANELAIEGRSATILWAAFNTETGAMVTGLVPLFPRGKMSSPSISYQGIGKRYVSLTVENIWSSLNFAPGGRWSAAGQHARYPGDKGFDFVDEKAQEVWQ